MTTRHIHTTRIIPIRQDPMHTTNLSEIEYAIAGDDYVRTPEDDRVRAIFWISYTVFVIAGIVWLVWQVIR